MGEPWYSTRNVNDELSRIQDVFDETATLTAATTCTEEEEEENTNTNVVVVASVPRLPHASSDDLLDNVWTPSIIATL